MTAAAIHGLYGVADAAFGDPWAQFLVLAEGGVGVVQLRCKGWPSADRARLAARCVAAGGPLVVVNDDVDAAARSGAWVHLGQDDGDTALPFGRSTHDLRQVRAAAPARYVGFGPVFATATKDTGYRARGLRALARAVEASPVPVVAIGGITLQNLDAVRATGVAAWAMIGAVWRAPDPRAVIARAR